MCDHHCEQHSSARDNRTFSGGATSEKEYPLLHHLPLSYILECKDNTYNTSIIFNTLMNADNLIIKLYLVKEKKNAEP